MKKLLLAFMVGAVAAPAFATDVSASIGMSHPGVYGQINIGNFPRPAVIYAEPVWVQRPPKAVYVRPVYLHVPPGHEKHWSNHCAEYGACGRPVYFVREDWYRTQYVPRYQHQDHYAQGASRNQDPGHPSDKAKGRPDRDD